MYVRMLARLFVNLFVVLTDMTASLVTVPSHHTTAASHERLAPRCRHTSADA